MSRVQTAFRVLAVVAGATVAVPALAQDATRPARTVTTAPPAATSARDDAAKTMPTYEAFGASDTESLSETFYRLSKDFASTAEVGVRRVGAVPIWPRGDMKFGPVRILPYVRQAVEYESNFYREDHTGPNGSPNANDAQWTHVNQAGALADMRLAGGRMTLAASIDAEWDVRYDNGNQDRGLVPGTDVYYDDKKEDTFEFDGQVGASYRWPSTIWVRGGIAYERRADPIDETITQEFQRTNNRAFLTWGADRDIFFGTKIRFEMGAAVRDVDDREEGLDDINRTEMQYYAKASYPFWKDTTRIFGRARYRQDERESDRINDGNVWGFDAGLEGSIPLSAGEYRGLRGQVGVGFDQGLYEDKEYESGSSTIVRDENSENTSLAFNVALQYMQSRKTTWDLRYLRTNQFSYHGNYQIVDRVDLTFSHNLTPNVTGRIGTFFEYVDPSGRLRQQDDTAPGDTTGEYPSTTRFGAGVGLRWKITDWMDGDVNYDWERRNHSITGFVNHRASFGLTFYLNALKARSRSTDDVAGAMMASDAPPARAASVAPAPRTAPAPAAAPASTAAPKSSALPRVAITTSGAAKIEGGSATSDVGRTLRLGDASARATMTFADGSTVDVTGPAVVQVVEVTAAGSRIQLVSGNLTARVRSVALEVQTPREASLVLQNAAATASVGAAGVTFQKTGGEFARVHAGGKAEDLSGAAWTRK